MKNIKIIIMILTIAFLFSACKKDNCYWDNKPDAKTGASQMHMMKDSMLKGKELIDVLKNPFGWPATTTFALTSVRCDGTPNIAVIIPMAISDKVLLFVNSTSTSKKNIMATKYARALIRIVSPKAKSKTNPNGITGSRLYLKLIEDKNKIKELYEKYNKMRKGKGQPLRNCFFMEIIEVYPIG